MRSIVDLTDGWILGGRTEFRLRHSGVDEAVKLEGPDVVTMRAGSARYRLTATGVGTARVSVTRTADRRSTDRTGSMRGDQ